MNVRMRGRMLLFDENLKLCVTNANLRAIMELYAQH